MSQEDILISKLLSLHNFKEVAGVSEQDHKNWKHRFKNGALGDRVRVLILERCGYILESGRTWIKKN
jgi:hypothetical protein